MRLRRLDLTRYGKFTDHSLDFGPAPEGGADFHIIYGPNEAGKSTTMQGWLDLLYGIPAQSRMNFLHPYAAMQLGAVIETGADSVALIRSKGRNNTLTDPSGAVLPEALLQGILGGIDRAGYEAMFSLDDETLEQGGESILSSQGDLGQMLFTASSGLAEMGQALDAIRARAQAFFRPGGRSGGLADLKKALAGMDQQIAEQDIGARDFAALVQARDQAQTLWDAAEAEQQATATRLHLVERQLAALPLVTRLRLAESALEALPDLPPLPPGWAAELPDLIRDQGLIRVRIDEQAAQLTALCAEFDAAVDDPAMLALETAMAQAEALKSGHDGAMRDLPARRAEASGAQARIDDLMRRLGVAGRDPADLLLPAPVVAALRALMAQHSGVLAAWHTARDEAGMAEERLKDLRAQLGQADGAQPDPAVLAEVEQAALRHDPQAALDRAMAAHGAVQDRWEAQLARLAPWHGDGAALAALALPAMPQVQDWQAALSAQRLALEQNRDAMARAGDETARITATITAQAAAGQIPLEMAAQIRAEREAAWAAHRADLSPQSAALFEAALRRDDQVTAALTHAQTEARQRAETQARLAALDVDKARAEADATAAAQRITALQADIAACLPKGLDPATPPEALAEWMRCREAALEAWALLQTAKRDLAMADAQQQQARRAMAAALGAAGQAVADDAPFALLAAQLRVLLERAQGQASLIRAHDEAAADLSRRRAASDRAVAAMQAWQDDWRAACAGSYPGESLPDVAAMGETLDLLQQLERACADLRGFQDRITKMQANRAAFETAVAELAARLGLAGGDPDADPDAARLWAGLQARRQAALRGQDRRQDLQGRIESATRAAQDLRDRLATLEARLDEICAHAGCADSDALLVLCDQARQRQELSTGRDQLVRDICEAMGTDRLDDAVAALDGLDRPVLAAERDGLAQAQQRQAQGLQQLYAALSQAQARIDAVGGDDAVARLQEQRQTLLLQIADEVQAHLRQRLGLVAVDHALQRYRDSHRSAMMQHASEAFRVITRGAYGSLAARLDGERELLVAVAAHGASKLARDLSKGTRFQLYLALRVAGFHEIAAARTTVPFIADDILETFDDDRAAETFALLAGMARVGQVIYLTHHRHLCDIARTVCPGIRVHSLA